MKYYGSGIKSALSPGKLPKGNLRRIGESQMRLLDILKTTDGMSVDAVQKLFPDYTYEASERMLMGLIKRGYVEWRSKNGRMLHYITREGRKLSSSSG